MVEVLVWLGCDHKTKTGLSRHCGSEEDFRDPSYNVAVKVARTDNCAYQLSRVRLP